MISVALSEFSVSIRSDSITLTPAGAGALITVFIPRLVICNLFSLELSPRRPSAIGGTCPPVSLLFLDFCVSSVLLFRASEVRCQASAALFSVSIIRKPLSMSLRASLFAATRSFSRLRTLRIRASSAGKLSRASSSPLAPPREPPSARTCTLLARISPSLSGSS